MKPLGLYILKLCPKVCPLYIQEDKVLMDSLKKAKLDIQLIQILPVKYPRVKDIVKNYDYISKKCVSNVDKFSWDRITGDYRKLYELIV